MGGLVSSLGFGGGDDVGAAGTKFAAGDVPLINAATEGQAKSLFDQSQSGLAQQQSFIDALKAQNGIQNQSDVYNQLQGIANGTGPNPAQAALNQATGTNIASQAALMAGQRGAGANPALIARQAALQGGNLQQQAAGQGATLQAQQALNAINQMGGIAGQQVGQQQGALQGYTGQALQGQQNILGAIGAQNQARAGLKENQNTANAGIAGTVAKGQQDLAGNLLGGAGAALGLAHGGQVSRNYVTGGYVNPSAYLGLQAPPAPSMQSGPQSNIGKFFSGQQPAQGSFGQQFAGSQQGGDALQKGGFQFAQGLGNGIRNALSSSGSSEGAPMAGDALESASPLMAFAARGGQIKQPIIGAQYAAEGKMVPGKAKVSGDSLKNDIVDAKLSPGEIIIPRSIAQSPDAARKSAEFVAAIVSKRKKSLPKKV